MSKRNKKTQYEKDRIKEKLVFFLWILSLVAMLVIPIVSCVYNAETGILENKLYMNLSLALFICIPAILFAIGFVICETIKTDKKKERYSYFEYEIKDVCNLKEILAKFGELKYSPFRDCDYYVSFTTKPDLFSKDLVVVANIEVDCNYTKKEYMKFIDNIPELYSSTRASVKSDYTTYGIEIFIVVFEEKEKCQFVDNYIKKTFYQWQKFHPLIVYNKEKSTLKLLKTGDYNDVIAKKYIKKIFNITSKPRIIVENEVKK